MFYMAVEYLNYRIKAALNASVERNHVENKAHFVYLGIKTKFR